MDIRESYLFVLNNITEDINLQIKDCSMLVRRNVVKAEQIYGPLFKWSDTIPYPDKFAEELTWVDGDTCSYFINRVISPKKEYERLTEQLNKIDKRDVISIPYKGTAMEENSLIIPGRHINNPFYFLHSKSKAAKLTIEAEFNMEWDYNYLYFNLSLFNGYDKIKQKHNYSFQILFGKSKEFSLAIGFDPVKSLYFCFLVRRCNNKLISEKTQIIPEIILENQQYTVKLKIPWGYIGFSPEKCSEMLMDVQITESKEGSTWEELATISWATGDKYYMNLYFNICEEFIMNKVKLT